MSTVIRMFASVRIKEANCERRFSNVSNFTPTLMKLGYNFRLKIRFSRTPSRHPEHFKSGSHFFNGWAENVQVMFVQIKHT